MHKKYFLLALGGLLSFALSAMQQQSALQHFPEVKTKKAAEAAQAERVAVTVGKFTYDMAALVKNLPPELQAKVWRGGKQDILGEKSYNFLSHWNLYENNHVIAHALSCSGERTAALLRVTGTCVQIDCTELNKNNDFAFFLEGYTGSKIKVYFTNDDKYAVVHDPDSGRLNVIDFAARTLGREYVGIRDPLYSTDNALIGFGRQDTSVSAIDVVKGLELLTVHENGDEFLGYDTFGISSDGRYMVTAYDKCLDVFDIATGQRVLDYDMVDAFAERPDSLVKIKRIYMHRLYPEEGVAGYDFRLVVETESPVPEGEEGPVGRKNCAFVLRGDSLKMHPLGDVTDVPDDTILFSDDKTKMLFVSPRNEITYWDTKENVYDSFGFEGQLSHLSFSADGSYFIIKSSFDENLVQYDVESGKILAHLALQVPGTKGAVGNIRSCAVSGNGECLLMLTDHGVEVGMFEEQTKKLVQSLHLDDQKNIAQWLVTHRQGGKTTVTKEDIQNIPEHLVNALSLCGAIEL